MIKLRDVGRWNKCNLWINENLDIECNYIKELQEVIIKDNWAKWDNVSYVIEIRILGRHASNYALLGINYKYQDINKLLIKVNSSKGGGKIIKETIASSEDEVHAGISQEYSSEIMRVANSYLNSVPCSTGTLTFDIGAHGYVGSSLVIFGIATKILLRILSSNNRYEISQIQEIVFDELNPKN